MISLLNPLVRIKNKNAVLKIVFVNLIFVLAFHTVKSQLRIIETGVISYANGEAMQLEPGGTEDLSGTTQTLDFETEDIAINRDFWIVNESETETYNVVCRRIELDVLEGTKNSGAWVLHPFNSWYAGEMPDWTMGTTDNPFVETLEPGDTVYSFTHDYYPENLNGCSLFEVRFAAFEDQDITYASFNLEYRHGCDVGIESLNNVRKLTLFPNPTNGNVQIDLTNEYEMLQLEIRNAVGEVITNKIVQGGGIFDYNTEKLPNGIFVVNIRTDHQIIASTKLSIQR